MVVMRVSAVLPEYVRHIKQLMLSGRFGDAANAIQEVFNNSYREGFADGFEEGEHHVRCELGVEEDE